jgi:hypothetical protein
VPVVTVKDPVVATNGLTGIVRDRRPAFVRDRRGIIHSTLPITDSVDI